jgi:protein-tyrosine phosphatase
MSLAISTILAPLGGQLGICPLPGREGRLAADFATIVAWSPRIVLSLTEQPEMAEFGADTLGDLLRARNINWLHFPVRDYGTPDPPANDAWRAISAPIHRVLDAGDAVLLHCMGGRGRSGMAALRLMVERGAEAPTAFATLRSAVPGAVETDAQYEWAVAAARNENGGG